MERPKKENYDLNDVFEAVSFIRVRIFINEETCKIENSIHNSVEINDVEIIEVKLTAVEHSAIVLVINK